VGDRVSQAFPLIRPRLLLQLMMIQPRASAAVRTSPSYLV